MRIQILPLPEVAIDDYALTPFVVIVDRLTDDDRMGFTEATTEWITRTWGATSVLVSDEIEIAPHLDLPDELRQALVDHLTAATKEHP